MSLQRKYLKVLSELIPSGAIGVSLLLGAAAPGEATHHAGEARSAAADVSTVSERLAAIRGAVSDITGAAAEPQGEEQQPPGGIGGVMADGAIDATAGAMAAGTIGGAIGE